MSNPSPYQLRKTPVRRNEPDANSARIATLEREVARLMARICKLERGQRSNLDPSEGE